MSNDSKPQCVHCQRNSDQVPLIALRYQDVDAWICPQHLPVLIHKPHELVGKVPGAENLSSDE